MEEEDTTTTTRSLSSRIPLFIGLGILLLAVACFAAGTPMFLTERGKEKKYIEDQCLVQSSNYRTVRNCQQGGGTKTTQNQRCFQAAWDVRYGRNKTQRGELYGQGERDVSAAIAESDKFRVRHRSARR